MYSRRLLSFLQLAARSARFSDSFKSISARQAITHSFPIKKYSQPTCALFSTTSIDHQSHLNGLLRDSIQAENSILADRWLKKGANPNAIQMKHPFESKNIRITSVLYCLLQASLKMGETQKYYKDLSKLLINHSTPDSLNAIHDESTALNIAVTVGDKELILALLEKGADPNIAVEGKLKPCDYYCRLVKINALELDEEILTAFEKSLEKSSPEQVSSPKNKF